MFTGFGNRILAWIAGGLHELVKTGDRAGWRNTGLTGRRCFGGTVAAGYLVVCIESESQKNEIWAYDGNGWWRIDSQPMPATGAWCNPICTGAGNGNNTAHGYTNVTIMSDGTNDYRLLRLADAKHSDGTYLPDHMGTAQAVTPMIDAGERDKPKAWRKLGVVFASPVLLGNTTSTDGVALTLDYSADGGETWVTAWSNNKVGNTLANMNFAVDVAISGLTSRFIMIRVTWGSVVDWAPVLTGIWVEYEVLNNPARRRKWNLRVHARDQEIDRDGQLFARTGRQLIESLWTAWKADTTLTFRDIDYDDDPVQRNVRIVGISESVLQPADSAQWGEATISLNLVEV